MPKFDPFPECSECRTPSGDHGCASLQLVETKSSLVPLCCECQRKMNNKGKIKNSFVWTSDVCRPCRDRKFSKCKGVFQKRTLSSNCACGLSLADHSITSQLHTTKSQRELTKPPAMAEYDFDDVPTNGGADERATQPSVPQGAQGAWDIGTPPPGRQPDDGEKVGTPGDWAVTDIPDSLHMQVGLQDDGLEGQQLGRRGSEDEGKEEERRQQKSMQAEKLLSKVQMRIMTGSSGSDCDTIAELAALLQSERSEKDALLERYNDLELKLDQTVQHVMGVMEGDKRRLREHIDMLEGTLHRVDGDKRALSKALQSEESKTMQLSHQVSTLAKEGNAAKQRNEKLASHARNAYQFITQTMDETVSQASASEHGTQVSNIIRARLAEATSTGAERSKAIEAIEQQVERACEAARTRAEDHLELEAQRQEAVVKLESLMNEREKLLLEREGLKEEAKKAREEAEAAKGELARVLLEWEGAVEREQHREMEGCSAERRADAAEQRALSAESRARSAESALQEALQALEMQERLAYQHAASMAERGGEAAQGGDGQKNDGVCWSVQKGGIKVLRPGKPPLGAQTPSLTASGVGSAGSRCEMLQSSSGGSSRDLYGTGGTEQYFAAEIGKGEVKKFGEMAEGSFGIVYRGEWEGANVAVKEMRLPAANLGAEELEEVVGEYRKEVSRLCQLRHPNVLSFFGTVTNLPTLGIVTELMEMDMRKYLRAPSSKQDPLWERLAIARQAFCGVAYLHRRRLVHRDVKPENFLLSGQGGSRLCKVCDFGLARVKEASHIDTMRIAGTMTYIAPEVHRGEPFDERSDVYSLSIITWELVTLQVPFGNKPAASIPGIVGWGQERPSVALLEEALSGACRSEEGRLSVQSIIMEGWNQEPSQRMGSQEGMLRLEACGRDLVDLGSSGSVRETMAA